jgi:hypothetical protein
MASQDQYLRQDVVATGDVTLGDDAGDATTVVGTLTHGDATTIAAFATDYGPGPLTNEVIYSFVVGVDDAASITVTVVDDANDDLYMASFNIAQAGNSAVLSSAYGIVDVWGGTNPTFNANYSFGTGPAGADEVQLRMSLADSVSVSVVVDAKLYAAVASPMISISIQPAINYLVTAPAPESINIVATTNDGGVLTYQWEVSSDGGSTWANATGGVYSGDTTNTLAITNSTGLNGYQYRCVVSSSGTASDATSGVGTLVVS